MAEALLTYTINYVPEFGKVRVIFTEGVDHSDYIDKIKEYKYKDIMEDPSLYKIKELIT